MNLGDDENTSFAQYRPRAVGVGDVIRDRFVLEAELGAGGMGRVFKALDLRRQEAHDRHPYVALKLLTHSFQQHPASLVALQREARRAQTLAHPNIITVFDFDRDGSLVYLIMEYLRGRTLMEILAEPGFTGLPFNKAMAIIRPVSEALAFAHDRGIVHSDLKPSNIFMSDDGRDDSARVKVIDFGIARAFRLPDAAAAEATMFDASSLRAFSPLYASPEMIDGDEEADPRDDVFSLACITYELISGNHPFGRRSAAVARGKAQTADKPSGLTGPQWDALRRGLGFSRAERTPTVESFLTGLDRRPVLKDPRVPPLKRGTAPKSSMTRTSPGGSSDRQSSARGRTLSRTLAIWFTATALAVAAIGILISSEDLASFFRDELAGPAAIVPSSAFKDDRALQGSATPALEDSATPALQDSATPALQESAPPQPGQLRAPPEPTPEQIAPPSTANLGSETKPPVRQPLPTVAKSREPRSNPNSRPKSADRRCADILLRAQLGESVSGEKDCRR